jgi:hypothetical protein
MKIRLSWLVVGWSLTLALSAQAPDVIPLSSEPHHHLVLQNKFVNLYDAKAWPGDGLLMHRHEHDAVAIAIGDQVVTIGVPGKPDVHSKNPDGTVRMQRAGYVHSTKVDGDKAYFTVAVELLHPQTGARNLCAAVLSGEPLHCPDDLTKKTAAAIDQLQYESEQTRIHLVRVFPRQTVNTGNSNHAQLFIALDPGVVSHGANGKSAQQMRAGDFAWFNAGDPGRTFANKSPKESRFIELTFLDSAPAGR